MGAKDILAELEEIGVFSEEPVRNSSGEKAVQSITIERAAPSVRLADTRGPRMVALCDQAVALLEQSVRAQFQLMELFGEMRNLWSEEEETEEAEDEPEVEAAPASDDEVCEAEEAAEASSDVETDVDSLFEEDAPPADAASEEPEPESGPAETPNAILDFYAENEAAGVKLGVQEEDESPAEDPKADPKEAFTKGRMRFMQSLQADAERGTQR